MAKRKLRSDTAAEAAAAPKPHPPDKKKKDQPVYYLCNSCATERVTSSFPDYNPSADCEHNIHTCKTCLKKWVQARIELNSFHSTEDGKVFGIQCPECPAIMRNVNIEIAATKKVYEQFEQRERHHIAESTPGWRWCLQPNCKAGQVHENTNTPEQAATTENEDAKEQAIEKENEPAAKANGKGRAKGIPKQNIDTADTGVEKKPAIPPEPSDNISTCHECGANACVNCERPYHDGETCKEYQARIKDRVEEEDQSIREIEKISRKCPSCSRNIQKNGGCPSMVCTQCNTNFCWNCLSVFHRGYCKCPRPTMRIPPIQGPQVRRDPMLTGHLP